MLIATDFRHPQTGRTTYECDPDISGVLAQARPCALSFHEANTMIYAQGDVAGPIYLVEFGAVRTCRMTADGRRQINAFHFAGEVFGFEAGDEHQSYAECIESAAVRVLRPNSGSGLGNGVLPLVLRSLERAEDHVILLGRMNALEKMAAFLVDLQHRQGGSKLVSLPMQRNDIADYLGLTFETVSRVLRVLKDDKIVRLERVDQIEILRRDALEDLCA